MDAGGELITGVALTNLVFETAYWPGRLIITIGIVMFAFATIIGWEYYGKKRLNIYFIQGKGKALQATAKALDGIRKKPAGNFLFTGSFTAGVPI